MKTKSSAKDAKAGKAQSKGPSAEKTEKTEKAEKEAEAPKSAKAETGGKGAIKLGDALPKITVVDHKGDEVKVAELGEGGRGVVLFLYPKVSCLTSSASSV